ncbi:MAG TPA: VCBS repeat-containing protein, partial [Planctomycetota bacterium]|nr:VCBS repeat-containing protein [Planctomycetota bacterium]
MTTVLRAPRTLVAAAFAVASTAAFAQTPSPWIEFSNQTATRLPTAAAVTTDPDEKDLLIVDIDHDGDVDVFDIQKNDVYFSPSARTHRLFLNVGGTFIDGAAFVPFAANPSIGRLGICADFTGDGWEDLVVVNTNDTGFGSTTQQQLQFYRNLGNDPLGVWLGMTYDTAGRFPQYTTPYARFCGGDHGDFDMDGDQDLYLGDYTNSLEDRLLFNDGTGVFTDVTTTNIPGGSASGFTVEVQVGDFNADGWPDIALSDPGSVRVRINNGAGVFVNTVSPPAPATYTLAVGDLNNDGKDDIYQGRDGQDGYNLSVGAVGSQTVTFTDVTLTNSPGTNAFAGNATVVDMDNDGWNDVIMGDI